MLCLINPIKIMYIQMEFMDFLIMLYKVEEINPDYICVVLIKGPTFRHEQYEQYIRT